MSSLPIRQALISSFGDISCINVIDAQLPPPAPSHVRINILYAGFGGSDVNMRTGSYPMQKKAPLVPGYSMIGRVSRNGPGCNKFAIGALVCSLTVYDADQTAANFPEKYLVPVPEDLDPKEAVALVLDWSTAYGMVMRAAKVGKGQRVFVHGMSGAVGYATMMLCMLQGAEVFGTASLRNHAALQKLGAHPFVYTDKKWMEAMLEVGGADAVFDPLGFESWDESYSIVNSRGILIGYGGLARALQPSKGNDSVIGPTLKLLGRGLLPWGKRTSFYYIARDQKTFVPELLELIKMLQQGVIQVQIKKVYDLEDIQEAHASWGKSEGMGSVVIKISDNVTSS